MGPCLDGENTVYLDIQEKENLSEEIFEVIDNDMEDDNNPLERSAVLTLHSWMCWYRSKLSKKIVAS